MELCETPIHVLHAQRMGKEITTEEIATSVLERIGKVEQLLHAFITLTTDGVLEAAKAADAQL